MTRKPYPSDVSDDEWAFVAPYLTLRTEDAPQREHPLREVFNGLRWIVRAGAPWRLLPNDLPPWEAVYQQTQRWLNAGVFEALVNDLRQLLRVAAGRKEQPSAAIFDNRTLQSSPESGARAGYDGAKRRKGSKVHVAVDTLGQLLALRVTPASDQDRAQVADLAAQVQAVTGESVEVAFVDQGYTGDEPLEAAAEQGSQQPGGARSSLHQTTGQARTWFLLLRNRVANSSRVRDHAHDQERAGAWGGKRRYHWSGHILRQPVCSGRLS